MKLQFDANLPYQEQAVAAAVDLFRGQTPMQCNFTVSVDKELFGKQFTMNGIGNKLELDEEEILSNLQDVQLRNGIRQTEALSAGKCDFDIEMETGTGKTYVYLRSIFELNKAYGFSKFIIVVPSIAIKEGVYKSLQITEDHFRNLYDNTVYDYFVYNSGEPEQIRSFALNDSISIMVINIDAFRKSFDDPNAESKANIIHRQNEKLNGMKPIELIRETNPFVIIDEPQSVDTTPKSKEAIASLNPLCTLRYSATHVDKHNLIYKMDAVDSFDMELVKQIEVASFVSLNNHNSTYLKLKSVDNGKSPITAKIEMDVNVKGKATRKTVTVKAGDDLYEVSKGRDVYEGYIIGEIYCEKGNEYVSFTSKPEILRIGEALGDIDDRVVKEQQIRKTIEEHLDKELKLNQKGIKVLSLFFIDRVANYRYYDGEGKRHNGIYAEIFERNYKELIQRPKYHPLFNELDGTVPVEQVHGGYFSGDKKGGNSDKAWKDTNGTTASDESSYNLIMKDKEDLLSFKTKLRFIFSHSALREGWDNPNVFQICTLNETNSEVKKRQEIGRGLRLCVNQNGERQHGFAINTLTVMANESYEEFAGKLQKEYEQDEGIRFGIIEKHTFANIPVKQPDGSYNVFGLEKSEAVFTTFAAKGYVDDKGKVQDGLKRALKSDTLELPAVAEESRAAVTAMCKKVCGSLKIKNSDDKRTIRLNKEVYLAPDFKEFWDRIKWKTTYSVNFDSEKLIQRCCEELQKTLYITSAKLVYTKAKVDVSAGGVDATETVHTTVLATGAKETLPDVVTYLQNRTNLTRRTIVDILIHSNTLELFKKNPQRYMEDVARTIAAVMRLMLVDGIKYTKIGDTEYYAQELFNTEELTGYLERNMVASRKSVYEYVVYDSDNEENFARRFENNDAIKLYAKLPSWFKIATPLGSYNPDWAVLIERDDKTKLYFVVETKASLSLGDTRDNENAKIKCGHKHFDELNEHGANMVFDATDNFEAFMEKYV